MAQASTTQTQTQNLYAVGIALVLGAFALSYYYLVPKLKEARTELKTQEATLKQREAEVAALQRGKVVLEKGEAMLRTKGFDDEKKLNAVMPEYEEIPTLYIQMEQLKGKNPNTPFTYTVGTPAEDKDGTVKVPVTVTGTGSYAALKDLVANLEANIRPLTFSTVAFSKGGKDQAAQDQLTVTAQGFVRSTGLSPQYQKSTTAK